MPLDIQGHRGARGLFPENTLPAFARAIEIGVTTLELDCAITRDGVVVVSHDTAINADIARDEAGAWLEKRGPPISSLTYAELQRYDVGRIDPQSEYAKRFPRQEPVDGTRIPRLEDVFSLVKRSGPDHVRFNAETKVSPLTPEETAPPETFVREMLAVICGANMQSRISIESFDWRTLTLLQTEAPEITGVYLTAEQDWMDNICRESATSPWTVPHHVSAYGESVPRMIAAAGGRVWSPYFEEATKEKIDEAHALGLKVIVWTVNEERDMRRTIDLGVDGIISDYPDVLVRVVRSEDR